jgi:hypothetical protein
MGRQIQSVLPDGSHVRPMTKGATLPSKVAPQAATDGHVSYTRHF